ncbi:unnamed protein product, partial [Urochloa humidicola]
DFYRCEEGHERKASRVAATACKKLVQDMHYEARVQAVIDYYAMTGVKVKKKEARLMYLTREQYISVIPWWCASHPDAWAMRVDRWCEAGWEAKHLAARDRRLQMPGPSHHMGSSNIEEFSERW